ncbi:MULTISPECIES: MBL fold metallo-hydrolase [Aminobacter]|uniref:Hydrolase n=2 Tax=Aminobacter TaxID=31988 RepID=A0AAC8YRC7_AMIAI|nr:MULTISPECIES: MBL fold metallo-hydrolase [Aminobacter]AMS43090.1 hydrolase [Aminobacter aminovorans]MBA8905400.1 ribonuclease BN (tRNA processing enzyme) [Aminobacter ciceronei]MBA9019300.1 ribonuclease BN (tRNA processing enzyme) [Aminobacter ciceronei]MBB3708524.1 ribonuclease BN (tRNA processing enzyme) [Aminobacter aminovorans]WMC99087.1 MBL fold metallo-hydrolase [Aminobacter aminovorans]
MSGRLVLLGTKGGPAIRPGGPWPTSTLLELGGRTVVVDCGLGVTRGVTDAGLSLKALDLVFITHLHSDHVLELGPLLHTAWTAGLATPVTLFGPVGLNRYWQSFVQALEFDIEIRIVDEGRPDLRKMVEVVEFGEGEVLSDGDLSVTALRVDHPPVTECFALRFEHQGTSIVFSADTAFFPPLADFARGADILLHEAMLEEGVERLVARTGNGARLREHLMASHSLAGEAGIIAARAGVGRLVLNHLIPADDPDIGEADWVEAVRKTWNGPLTIGRDGLVVTDKGEDAP